MQTITTTTGKVYQVNWCAPSTIDFALRFEIVGSTMQDVLATFTDPEETATLTHKFDESETVFTGYTLFIGVDMRQSGKIIVALMEG